MTGIGFRLARQADRSQILGIAAQVWEGDDYIPDVIDEWLAPGPGKLVVATIEDQVAALARYELTMPGYAWFEGLRTDPAFRNRGLAKALTEHLIALATAEGADRIGLSTYVDNSASQRVSAAFGFVQVAAFVYCTMDLPTELAPSAVSADAGIIDVPLAEAAGFVANSAALAAGAGFLPHSWRFYPFARGPEIALRHTARVFGVANGSRFVACMCIGDQAPHGPASFSIDFLEGERGALPALVRHALSLLPGTRYVEAMVPCPPEGPAPALEVLRDAGFKVWNNGIADVLVLERTVL